MAGGHVEWVRFPPARIYKHTMERIWFRKTIDGLLWKPVAWQGWVVLCVWCFVNMWKLIQIDAVSHSASDTLLNAAPFFIVTTLVYLLIVRKTSGRNWE